MSLSVRVIRGDLMSVKIVLAILSTMMLLAGCAGRTPQLQSSDRPVSDAGYIYGRCSLNASPRDCRLEVALVVTSEKGKERERRITFIKSDLDFDQPLEKRKYTPVDVVGIAVEPGEYTIESVDFIHEDGSVNSRKSFDKHFGLFTVEKGKAYYVGDFSATTRCLQTGPQGFQYSWSMKEQNYNFIRTTADFVTKFVFFTEYPKVAVSAK
jgi:hypothetical protein